MKTEHKIYVAVVLLAGMGGGLYFATRTANAEKEQRSVSSATADLPAINLAGDDVDKVTKLEVTVPNKDKDKPAEKFTLEKKDADWVITSPFQAKAAGDDVKNLVGKLKDLKTTEAIDRSATEYASFNLDDAKATHIVAYKGGDKAVDLYFGKSGKRGQVVRTAAKDGVYIATGYDAMLFGRDAKGWRDKNVLKLKDDDLKDAQRVQIDNANGEFVFEKKDGKWVGSFAKLGKDGQPKADDTIRSVADADKPADAGDKKDADKKDDKSGQEGRRQEGRQVRQAEDADKKDDKSDKKDADKKDDKADKPKKGVWEKFDPKKIDDLFQPLKALTAVDFADADAKPADTGLEDPTAQGGVIRIKLKDREVVIKVGKAQKGKNRFATVDGGDGTVFVISSWFADWVAGDQTKFEKDAKPAGPGGPGPGGAPPMPMQMPPGGDEPDME